MYVYEVSVSYWCPSSVGPWIHTQTHIHNFGGVHLGLPNCLFRVASCIYFLPILTKIKSIQSKKYNVRKSFNHERFGSSSHSTNLINKYTPQSIPSIIGKFTSSKQKKKKAVHYWRSTIYPSFTYEKIDHLSVQASSRFLSFKWAVDNSTKEKRKTFKTN